MIIGVVGADPQSLNADGVHKPPIVGRSKPAPGSACAHGSRGLGARSPSGRAPGLVGDVRPAAPAQPESERGQHLAAPRRRSRAATRRVPLRPADVRAGSGPGVVAGGSPATWAALTVSRS